MRKQYGVTAMRFLEVWQSSNSAEEAAQRLGMPKAIANARASGYRKAGVNLKKMPRRPKNRVDVEALNRKIDELQQGA
jgi:hypothetical protein